MAAYDVELIQAARRLVRRRAGQRGKLPAARVRRSVSTAYYALFHFVLEEAARSLIGSHNDLRRRRGTFARLFSHIGIKATFEKIRGTNVDPSVEDLLRPRGVISGPVPAPAFARDLALLKEFGVVGVDPSRPSPGRRGKICRSPLRSRFFQTRGQEAILISAIDSGSPLRYRRNSLRC